MCSNFSYDGETLDIVPNPVFKVIIKNNLSNKKLLEPCQNRTICIELYKVIKSTNSNLFRQMQGYNDDRINKLYAS